MRLRGKEININSKNNYTVKLGTVNNQQPKCIYFEIKGWVTPTEEDELNYKKIIQLLNKRVKSSIHKNISNTKFIKDITIVDFDLRDSGIKYGKKSYFNCEVTLYQQEVKPIHELTHDIGSLTSKLINEIFEPFEYFRFHKKKKELKLT